MGQQQGVAFQGGFSGKRKGFFRMISHWHVNTRMGTVCMALCTEGATGYILRAEGKEQYFREDFGQNEGKTGFEAKMVDAQIPSKGQ